MPRRCSPTRRATAGSAVPGGSWPAGTIRGRRSQRSSGRSGARAASCSRTATASCTRWGGRTRSSGSASLADLKDYLPRSNDPGCSAGFAHGLVTGVAPSIDPRRAARGGDGLRGRRHPLPALQLRPRARARVHADLQRPAGAGARPLPRARPAGGARLRAGRLPRLLVRRCRCRQRLAAGEAVTDPRELCGSQPAAFVRPCWYRAFVDNRPEGIVVDSAEHFDVLCDGLDGLQREACITARVRDRRLPIRRSSSRSARSSRPGRCSQLRPRHEGAEPARRVDGRLRPADRPLRALRRRRRAAPATAGSARRSPSSPTATSLAPGARSSPAAPAGSAPPARAAIDDALVTFS